jgi:hypothetical protein
VTWCHSRNIEELYLTGFYQYGDNVHCLKVQRFALAVVETKTINPKLVVTLKEREAWR